MVPVARRNLLTEKVRLAISVAGVGFAVLLMLVVLGLYRGWSSIGGIMEELPADLWVAQEGTTDPFHSVSLLRDDVAKQVAEVPGVLSVSRAYARTMAIERNGESIPVFLMALEPEEKATLPASIRERFLPPEGRINIDEVFADKHGLGPGDLLRVGGRDLRVGSIFSGGNAVMFQFAFLSPEDARATFGVPGVVNYLLVNVEGSADVERLSEAIPSRISGVTAFTSAEFREALSREIDEGFLPVVAVLVAVGFAVGVAVIGLTIYTATIERARDFGVLKAIGATAGYVYRIIISQSLMVGVLGFAVGLAVTYLVARLATEAVPEFVTDIRLYDVLAVFAASLVMAVLSSYIPVRRIAGIDPASVFRA